MRSVYIIINVYVSRRMKKKKIISFFIVDPDDDDDDDADTPSLSSSLSLFSSCIVILQRRYSPWSEKLLVFGET